MSRGTRIVVVEVRDTRAEDLLKMAIQQWNEDERHLDKDDRIHHRVLYSCPVGDKTSLAT